MPAFFTLCEPAAAAAPSPPPERSPPPPPAWQLAGSEKTGLPVGEPTSAALETRGVNALLLERLWAAGAIYGPVSISSVAGLTTACSVSGRTHGSSSAWAGSQQSDASDQPSQHDQ